MDTTLILQLLLLVFHYATLNGLEKILVSLMVDFRLIRRPSTSCSHHPIVGCYGMPSGHAEIAVILVSILYHKSLITQSTCFWIVSFVILQRVFSCKHSANQVVAGVLLGLVYSELYRRHTAYIFLVFIALLASITAITDNKLRNFRTPEWLDPKLLTLVRKKQNSAWYIKVLSVWVPSFQQQRQFILDWQTLQLYLDEIVAKIKASTTKYDCVVGVKSGGAIVSNYIAKKLKLINVYMKVSTEDNNCKKTARQTLSTLLDIYYLNKKKKYIVCEKIERSLQGKNVILIDESVASGGTAMRCIDYLKDEKKVGVLSFHTIYTNKPFVYREIEVDFVHQTDTIPLIWPWGYDN